MPTSDSGGGKKTASAGRARRSRDGAKEEAAPACDEAASASNSTLALYTTVLYTCTMLHAVQCGSLHCTLLATNCYHLTPQKKMRPKKRRSTHEKFPTSPPLWAHSKSLNKTRRDYQTSSHEATQRHPPTAEPPPRPTGARHTRGASLCYTLKRHLRSTHQRALPHPRYHSTRCPSQRHHCTTCSFDSQPQQNQQP